MAQRNSSGRGGAATATRRQAGSRATTPAEISQLRVDEIRKRLRAYGVTGISGLRKPELVQALVRAERRGGGAAKRSTGPAGRARAAGGGARTGAGSARSVRSSQQIVSLADQPERPGRSLVTTNHEVIQRWARARKAKPATIAGTERDGRAGVLTFDLPGYRESRRLRQITWEEWFRTFDERRLNLIYQEQLRDGRPSNFFRTESPDREDA